MEDSSVEKIVGGQLPEIVLFPDQNGDEPKVKIDPAVENHLEDKDSAHDDHQIFDHGSQTIPKRVTVSRVGHSGLLRTCISNIKVQLSNKIQMSKMIILQKFLNSFCDTIKNELMLTLFLHFSHLDSSFI
jgi:hypothetical protein